MAQTIALQRGTASITWDGTTQTTLWTQSGGTATRVIFNGCSAYNNTASAGNFMSLFVKLSGGGSYGLAATRVGNSTITSALTFCPGNVNVTGGANGSSQITSGSTIQTYNVAGSYPLDIDMTYVGLQGGASGGTGFTSQNVFEFCPAQFWIGPGDAIVFKCKGATSNSGAVAYSFTTITES
jgi:hypothetical protein